MRGKSGEISHLRRSNRFKRVAAESMPKQPAASDSSNRSSESSLEGIASGPLISFSSFVWLTFGHDILIK